VTNGPLLGLRIEGSAAGDEIRLDAPRSVRFEAAVRSIAHLDHVEILVNGKAVRSLALSDGKNGLEVVRVMQAINESISRKGAPVELASLGSIDATSLLQSAAAD